MLWREFLAESYYPCLPRTRCKENNCVGRTCKCNSCWGGENCQTPGASVSVRQVNVFQVVSDPTKEPDEYTCPGDVIQFDVLYNIPRPDNFDSYVSFRASSTKNCTMNVESPLIGPVPEGIWIDFEKKEVVADKSPNVGFIKFQAVTAERDENLKISAFARVQGQCEKLISEESSLYVDVFFNYSAETGCILDGTRRFNFKLDLKQGCSEAKTVHTKDSKAPIIQSGQDLQPEIESVVQVSVFAPTGTRLLNSSISFECFIPGAFDDVACKMNYTSLKAGSNLPGLNYEYWEPKYSSDCVNGREDVMTIPLGTIVNTGYSNYADTVKGDEDQLNLTITIKPVGVSYPDSVTFSIKTILGSYKSEKTTILKIANMTQTNSQDSRQHRSILKMEITNLRKENSAANWNRFFVRLSAQMDS